MQFFQCHSGNRIWPKNAEIKRDRQSTRRGRVATFPNKMSWSHRFWHGHNQKWSAQTMVVVWQKRLANCHGEHCLSLVPSKRPRKKPSTDGNHVWWYRCARPYQLQETKNLESAIGWLPCSSRPTNKRRQKLGTKATKGWTSPLATDSTHKLGCWLIALHGSAKCRIFVFFH